RPYDRVVAFSRSGTTTEVLDALDVLPVGTRRVAVTAVAGTPIGARCDQELVLAYADEHSIVQTRFPTTVLALIRAAVCDDAEALLPAVTAALATELPVDAAAVDHVVFLGTGWTVGLANEAALKVRETAQAWSESYPAMDFRHGPIAVARSRSLVW